MPPPARQKTLPPPVPSSEWTLPQLRRRAAELEIPGRSRLTRKADLLAAVVEADAQVRRHRPPTEGTAEATAARIAIWDQFQRTPTIEATAGISGYSEAMVRRTVFEDHERLREFLADRINVAMEATSGIRDRAIGLLERMLDMAEAMVREIEVAAAENRTTHIRDRDGYEMPVLDALQFVVMSRLLDQVSGVAGRADDITHRYMREGGAAGGGPSRSHEHLSDDELLLEVERRKGTLPPIWARKLRRLRQKADKKSPAD